MQLVPEGGGWWCGGVIIFGTDPVNKNSAKRLRNRSESVQTNEETNIFAKHRCVTLIVLILAFMTVLQTEQELSMFTKISAVTAKQRLHCRRRETIHYTHHKS